MMFFDIGANIGVYSLYAASKKLIILKYTVLSQNILI